MINLLLDEAYAFDYPSVLDIKCKKKSDYYDAWINTKLNKIFKKVFYVFTI